jgi:hypothetical protein
MCGIYLKQPKRWGISYKNSEVFILYGFKYKSIFLVGSKKRKRVPFYKWLVYHSPDLEQSQYELNLYRHKIGWCLGLVIEVL